MKKHQLIERAAKAEAEVETLRESLRELLSCLNEPQLKTLREIARQYPHGWHDADLLVRADARVRRYEADWALHVARFIAKAEAVLVSTSGRDGMVLTCACGQPREAHER